MWQQLPRFLFGEFLNGGASLCVVLISAMMGFITKLWAVPPKKALYKVGHVQRSVLMNGQIEFAEMEVLVPGDIVRLEDGDVITTDLRIFEF